VPDYYVVAENLLHVYRHPVLAANGLDDDGDGVADELGEQQVLLTWPRISSFDTMFVDGSDSDPFPTHYFTYRTFRSRQLVEPVDARYWNDMRNTDYSIEWVSEWNDDYDQFETVSKPFTTGSPLTPALPQMVSTFFTFFFESPEVNVPDFMRDFDQRIDIPTGYRRLPPL
jgi:hypothetical protein